MNAIARSWMAWGSFSHGLRWQTQHPMRSPARYNSLHQFKLNLLNLLSFDCSKLAVLNLISQILVIIKVRRITPVHAIACSACGIWYSDSCHPCCRCYCLIASVKLTKPDYHYQAQCAVLQDSYFFCICDATWVTWQLVPQSGKLFVCIWWHKGMEVVWVAIPCVPCFWLFCIVLVVFHSTTNFWVTSWQNLMKTKTKWRHLA